MVTLPNIYQLTLDSHTSVAKGYNGNKRIWVPRLRRDPNDWEVRELLNLLEILGNLKSNNDRGDGWLWKLNQKRRFTSISLYSELSNFSLIMFPHKGIWLMSIPSIITFLCGIVT